MSGTTAAPAAPGGTSHYDCAVPSGSDAPPAPTKPESTTDAAADPPESLNVEDPMGELSAKLKAYAELPKGQAEQLMMRMWQLDARDAGHKATATELLQEAEALLAAESADSSNEMLRVALQELRRIVHGDGDGEEDASDDGTESDNDALPLDSADWQERVASVEKDVEVPPSTAGAKGASDDVLWATACGSRVITENSGGEAVIWDAKSGDRVRCVDSDDAEGRVRRAVEILEDPDFNKLPHDFRTDAVKSCQRVFNALNEEQMMEHIDIVHRLTVCLRRQMDSP